MSEATNQPKTAAAERQPMVYRDFNLRFGGYDETSRTFKVWVEGETPGGSMRPDNAVQCMYDPNIFWDNPELGTGGLIGGLERRKLEPQDMFRLGALLADLALPPGEVRALFDKSRAVVLQAGEGLRLRFHIDPGALVHLPWEFIALSQASGEPTDTDFLALQREISIVRTDTVEMIPRSLPPRNTVRVVGILSSPSDETALAVEDDKEAIEKAVQTLNEAVQKSLVEMIWAERPATKTALIKALEEGADIFHFSGHGIFNQFTSEGQILLEDATDKSDPYDGSKLAQLLRDAGVRLAVLGACETGRRDGKNVWSGVAPALTRENIPAVIANQFKIKDDNSVLIASKVYHRVLAGYTVDEALFEARQAIYQYKGLAYRDWGTPVLYLREQSGVLFSIPKTDLVGTAAKSPFLEVANHFKQVKGNVIDVTICRVTGGRIKITDTVDVVEQGANFTSVCIKEFG